jgi:hypothetical protein
MKRFCVRDLHGPLDERSFEALPPDARLQWREPLAPHDLTRAVDWLRAHSDASLRLYGNACSQLGALAGGPFLPSRLGLDATGFQASLRPMPGVLDLTLDGAPPDLGSMLAAVPALETFQADFRGAAFEPSALSNVARLRRLSLARTPLRGRHAQPPPMLHVLELRDVGTGIDDMLRIPSLRAVRLSAIAGLQSVDVLADHPNLRILALESLLHLDSLRVLSTLPRLESLDIAGLWQFSLADVDVITSLKGLRRLAIDIGGRRKNVEIYKQMRLPKPPPFDVRYDLMTS